MKEFFLHYLWHTHHFDMQSLTTTQGTPVRIQEFGSHNLHAGPDFTNAKILIGDTLWAGNVEMHVRSSEWLAHQHQTDAAYNNVILHVVYEEDQAIFHSDGHRIPCIELRGRIPKGLAKKYQQLIGNHHWISCEKLIQQVPEITRNLWLDRMLVERLEQKTTEIKALLQKNKNDWESTFYHFLAKGFGLYINSLPFEQLAIASPLSIARKHRHSLLQMEAFFFGQAGFLENSFQDTYPKKLQREYRLLRSKYQLQPLRKEAWKFARLRPASFPTIRIAQFAKLYFQSNQLFSKLLAVNNSQEIENMFDIKISNYWQTHYRFERSSIKRNKRLGKSSIHLLIINVIVPILFLYGKFKDDDSYQRKAMSLLEELPPEINKETKGWKTVGLPPRSAYQSQALLQLKRNYCHPKRCTQCAIGHKLLSR